MSSSPRERLDIFATSADILIKDLIRDELVGYTDILDELDPNLIDRQASLVVIRVYDEFAVVPTEELMPLIVKEWIALNTVKRVIPGIRNFIAKNEKRSDVQRDGYVTFYDQLNNLSDMEQKLDRRLILMATEVQLALSEDFAAPPGYDRPGITTADREFVTPDPFDIGYGLFSPCPVRKTWT